MQRRIDTSKKSRDSRRRGQSLIGLLISVVIGIILVMLFLMPGKDIDGKREPGIYKKSMNKAEDVNTTSNISQIQQGIEMYKIQEGHPPASLDEFRNSTYGRDYPPEMFVDSVSKQPLNYDPRTGAVSSPTGGLPNVPGSKGTTPNPDYGTGVDRGPGGVDLSGVPGAGTATSTQSQPQEPSVDVQ